MFFSHGDVEGSAIRCQDAKASSAQIEAKLKAVACRPSPFVFVQDVLDWWHDTSIAFPTEKCKVIKHFRFDSFWVWILWMIFAQILYCKVHSLYFYTFYFLVELLTSIH